MCKCKRWRYWGLTCQQLLHKSEVLKSPMENLKILKPIYSMNTLDFYDFLEWRRCWPRFLRGLTLFQTGKGDYFNFTAVSLTLSSVTATGNVFMKIRLQIFSQLSGSPRVIWGQTVNLPGVFLCNLTCNLKWQWSGVFSSADWLVWFAYMNPEQDADIIHSCSLHFRHFPSMITSVNSAFPGQLHFSAVGMHALAPLLPDF